MTDQTRILTLGSFLFGIILLAALTTRFLSLSEAPLGDGEATHALAAFAVVDTDDPKAFDTGPDPTNAAYHIGTVGIFSFLPITNVTARILSALAGVLFIFSLILLRDRIGDPAILLLAAIFTISPVLLTIGRTAGGAAIAILGLVGTIVLLLGEDVEHPRRSRLRWASALFGLSLAAGPAAIYGLIGLFIGFVFSRLDPVIRSRHRIPSVLRSFSRELWIALLVAILVATGVGILPSGMDAIAGAITEWLHDWVAPAEYSIPMILILLALYEPFVLVFGLIGAGVAIRNKDPFGRAAMWWSIGSLVYALIYPGRNPALLAWIIIPMSYLAARALLILAEQILQRRSWPEWAVLTAVLIIMATVAYFFMLNFTLGLGPSFAVLDPVFSIGFAVGVIVFTVLILVMFGLGWSWELVWLAGGTAAVILLLTFTISSAWRLNYVNEIMRAQMLWDKPNPAPGLSKIIDTLELVADKDQGFPDRLKVYLGSESPPMLAWAIRDYEQIDRPVTGTVAVPAILFSSQSDRPTSPAGYIGQSLSIRMHPAWSGLFPPDPLHWLFMQDAEFEYEPWIVLVRSDLVSLAEEAPEEAP